MATTPSTTPATTGVLSVINSRKFWFAYVVPLAISGASLYLKVITPTEFIAAATATTTVYGATVAYEDAHS